MNTLAGKKILVVDDEELLREILMEDLAAYEATVMGAENGDLAFDLVKKENFDAIVTDIRMPGGNGVILIKNINSHFQKDRPKIFVCSGYNDVSRTEIENMSVTHTFNKPFDREVFIQTLIKHLNESVNVH